VSFCQSKLEIEKRLEEKKMKEHGKNHKEVKLHHGNLHVFANDEVFSQLERKVFKMANHNLGIPRNLYMSYTPDAHVAAGTCVGTTAVWKMEDGFVSPSIVGSDIGCGMRVHLTPLHKEEIQDKKLRRKMLRLIEKYVPTKEHTPSRYKNIDLEHVVKNGIHGLPSQYVPDLDPAGDTRSITHVESAKFPYDEDVLQQIPAKMWMKSLQQIGSLGGGNHFVEMQSVRIAEEKRELAQKWGLFDGQVIVMIHSGSRAWGSMLRPQYTEEIQKAMQRAHVSTPDPKLIYVPIASAEGQRYINLMYSALNYAVVNRHMIAYGVREGMKNLFGSQFEMPVLYDLMHNYALTETHGEQSLLVHRKGTTRALPAGHVMNHGVYQATAHPVLIPGSMGTSSYIMVGEAGGEANFYSVCHGAGRIHARQALRQPISVDQFARSLKVGTDDEIIINQWTLESILDECPQAYKDVDQIIDSVVGAGLASVVAECKPLAVVKGL
jgi:tRNA-splicing ligase RtcB (3'-phosphate/5'-hydroxy nucleic acid ligase)